VIRSSSEVATEDSPPCELPLVLQQITDERAEFNLRLGKAMDTIRADMPDILWRKPGTDSVHAVLCFLARSNSCLDFSIYDENIRVIDPSGVQLCGLDKYRSAIAFFQTFVGFWCHTGSTETGTGLQYRMVYDCTRSCIRVGWHATLQPKVVGLFASVGRSRPLYIDGISYYQLDRTTGKIVEHKVEKLVINNTPVTPPYGIWSILQQDLFSRVGGGGASAPHRLPVPVGAGIPATFR
jgi:hypothetical protein